MTRLIPDKASTVENNPTPRWKSAPKTLSAALKRIEELQQNAHWLQEEIAGCRRWGEQNAAERSRLERLITYRAKVGDATAHCPHANTEVGKLTGNVYCQDCQEIVSAIGRVMAEAVGATRDG